MPGEKTIICPNCGSEAVNNYCSQCGQPTHLHEETLGSLITHFFAHYFHYESKFWQTMKMLWTKPGALTVAFRNKQRMRHVPPLSLYIFIVAIYFILSSLLDVVHEKLHPHIVPVQSAEIAVVPDTTLEDTASNKRFLSRAADKIERIDREGAYSPEMVKVMPKIFFFMVPVLAIFLKLLFRKRKGYLLIDHIIFSLHLFTFFFGILFLTDILGLAVSYSVLTTGGFILLFLYCIRAMMVVYGVRLFPAIIKSALAFIWSTVIFALLLTATIVYLVE